MSRRYEHPGQRGARLYFAVGTLGLLASLIPMTLTTGPATSVVFSGIFLGIGAFCLSQGRVLARFATAASLMASTANRIAKGELDEAERELQTSKLKGRSWGLRTLGLLEATIALARGNVDVALHAIEPATAPARGLLLHSWEEELRVQAIALRALARAASGQTEAALTDVATVETHPQARPPSLAQAALARALTLKDATLLMPHIQATAGLILEHGGPRERLLLRALRGLGLHERSNVYREAARASDEPMNEGDAADANAKWVLSVAPRAARYAPRRKQQALDRARIDESASFAVSPDALRRIADSRRVAVEVVKSKRKRWKTFAFAAVAFSAFLAIVFAPSFFAAPLPDDPNAPLPPETFMQFLSPILVVLVAIPIMGGIILWGRRLTRKSALADRAALSGNDEEAVRLLREIAAISNAFVAERVFAHARLAMLATRRGDFEDALKECDFGTGLASLGSLLKLSDLEYFPTLLSERAFVLAALGRIEEAETEMATVVSSYPNFSALERASFRVRLLIALKSGDLAKAARLAQSRSEELPTDLRTELLADAVLVKANVVTRMEAARIRSELDAAPHHLQSWVRSLVGDLAATEDSESAGRARVASADVREALEEGLEERVEVVDRDLRRLHL